MPNLATLCIITNPFHTAGTFFVVLLRTEGETGGWDTVAESGELKERRDKYVKIYVLGTCKRFSPVATKIVICFAHFAISCHKITGKTWTQQ